MPRRTRSSDTPPADYARGALSTDATVTFAAMRQSGAEQGEPHATTRALMSGTATRADRLAHIREALAVAGLVGRVTPPPVIPKVTTKQSEVLDAIAQGMSNTEIRDHLSMNVQTVKGHQGNMYRAFGVNTRVELVVEATRCGILPPLPARRSPRPSHVPPVGDAPVEQDDESGDDSE